MKENGCSHCHETETSRFGVLKNLHANVHTCIMIIIMGHVFLIRPSIHNGYPGNHIETKKGKTLPGPVHAYARDSEPAAEEQRRELVSRSKWKASSRRPTSPK